MTQPTLQLPEGMNPYEALSLIPQDVLDQAVTEYVESVLNYNGHGVSAQEKLMITIMSYPNTAPVVISAVLGVLLESDTNAMALFIDGGYSVALAGLDNPACPADVLVKACQHPHSMFRYYASQHPNCPEENAVLVALEDDTGNHAVT